MIKYISQFKMFALIFTLLISINLCYGQPKVNYEFKTHTPLNDIKTLRHYLEGNELAYPVIELGSEQVLSFEFDHLGTEGHNFQYQLIHCNSSWEVSDLFSDEFMDGFNENYIADYNFSQNTLIPYVNYRVQIPNDDVQLKVSGNYILRIIEDGNRDNTIAMFQFSVYEPLVRIDAQIERPLGMGMQDLGQEIRLNVNYEGVSIDDPFNTVKVRVAQNGRPDRIIKDIYPLFVKNNELIYGMAGDHQMLSGNEFRTFDIRNFKLQGLRVRDVVFDDTVYNVFLHTDERRSYKRYVMEEEMNGKFVIFADNSYEHNVAADYAWVDFTLAMPEPLLEGEVHIMGEFTRWTPSEQTLMSYNARLGAYTGRLLLKQGYYDYYYAFVKDADSNFDDSRIDGSHYQTENDYQIFIYYRSFGENYDRMVGYKVINSRFR